MNMIWISIIAGALLCLYFYIKKKLNVWKEKGIKYIKSKFLIGNIIKRQKSLAEITQDMYNHFPEERYHGIYQFLQPMLILKDPDLIKEVTIKKFDHFVDHERLIDPDLDPYWSKNLFAIEGEQWRDMRSILSPSYTSNKMRIMFTLMNECAQQFVKFFKKQKKEVVEVEIKDAFSRYTNDVIASTGFGLKCDSLENRNNSFYLMGSNLTNFGGLRGLQFVLSTINPIISKILNIKFIPRHIAKYFSKIIENTVKMRDKNRIIRADMIQLLMEAQKRRHHQEQEYSSSINEGFSSVSESDLIKNKQHKAAITIEDITANALIFFMAGFETVATLLTFAFYELAINPTIQNRLREELLKIQDNVSYENLLKLKYLDMVVSETLRRWPPSIFTNRKVTKAFTIQPEKLWEKPLQLEEGLVCWLPIYAIHNDPKFWPNPDKFDPERFSDENKCKINLSTFMPFGAGPRNCIGSRFGLLEAKLALFHVLSSFEVLPIKKTQIPVVLDRSQLNLTAQGGVWLGLKKI